MELRKAGQLPEPGPIHLTHIENVEEPEEKETLTDGQKYAYELFGYCANCRGVNKENIAQLMKQANQMQKKLNKVQNAFNEKVFDFVSDDGNIQGR